MAWTVVRSKAVILLVLIYCLMYFPLFVGVLCLSLFCYALLCVLSSFAVCFASIVLRLSCFCKCSVAFPRDALGWSAVCDCGMPGAYPLTFLKLYFLESGIYKI